MSEDVKKLGMEVYTHNLSLWGGGASFGCVLRIKKKKTQPTQVLFVHFWKSFPDSGKGWA